MSTAAPAERLVFDTARLVAEHPPALRHPNKQVVYDVACPDGCRHAGELVYTRWAALPVPDEWRPADALARQQLREDVYDYAPVLPPGAVEWHVNFADPHLFVAYGSALFAQDEMQVAEHPALASLKEALAAGGHTARTVEHGEPTPVLVRGVERRCRVETRPNAAEGRPHGLYGNAFGAASAAAVRKATHPIHPPTITNLIAIAAPSYGSGRYTRRDIEYVLRTAFTGFRAAVLESGGADVAIHTGFWGCGAFGGNRTLMTLLQLLAASAAGAHRLVFHAVDAAGGRVYADALRVLETRLGTDALRLPALLDVVEALGLEWGVSDGN